MENMKITAFWVVSLALLCQGCLTDLGSKKAPECLREGFYAAAGEQTVHADYNTTKAQERLGDRFKTCDSYGPELRAGYRFNPYVATELLFQNYASSDYRYANRYVGYYDVWAVTLNLKGYYPIADDFQPYASVGAGYIDWLMKDGLNMGLNRNQGELAGRLGLGFDAYITKNWVFYMEFSYTHTFDAYLDDYDLWPIAAGLQFRF
ncbi:MAG: porin family protein [Planctomycetota bacterium]